MTHPIQQKWLRHLFTVTTASLLLACHFNDELSTALDSPAQQDLPNKTQFNHQITTAGEKLVIQKHAQNFRLKIDNQPIALVLKKLAEIAHFNFQSNIVIEKTITLSTDFVPLENALDQILMGYHYSLEKLANPDQPASQTLRIAPIEQVGRADFSPATANYQPEAGANLYRQKLTQLEKLDSLPIAEALPALATAAGDEQLAIRLLAIEQLKNINQPGATEILLSLIDDPDTLVVKQTIVALSQSDDTTVISAIEAKLQHPQLEVQLAALEALSNFAAATSLSAISALSTHDNPKIRFKVIQALGEIGTDETIPFLLQALSDTDLSVSRLSRAILDELNYFTEE